MTTDERKVTLLGETATVPEDERFYFAEYDDGSYGLQFDNGTQEVEIWASDGPTINDYRAEQILPYACEAAIVHFMEKANWQFYLTNDSTLKAYDNAQVWMRILEKVRGRT